MVATVYVTYSLSDFVFLTSGSFPRRPMRTSLARSLDRAGVVENARVATPVEKAERIVANIAAERRSRSSGVK